MLPQANMQRLSGVIDEAGRPFEQHARVAFEPGELGALNSAAAEARGIFLGRPIENFVEVYGCFSRARLEGAFDCWLLKAVPGTHVLADVAAINPAAHLICYMGGQLFASKFNCCI